MKQKLTTISIRSSAINIALVAALQGCGSSAKAPAPAVTSGPSGRVFSGDPKFYDGSPSLSADGLKLAFESGRSSSILRIFKVNVPSDPSQSTAATDEPTRLTGTDDLTSEASPALAPNGNNVAFIGGTSDGARSSYITAWAGGSATKFSADGEMVYSHGFSPDSLLIAYAARNATSGANSVIVVDAANSAARATLATGTRNITSLRWLRDLAGPGYKLATVALMESSGASLTRIETWTFSNVAGVAAASATTLTDKAVMAASDDAGRWIAQDGTRIMTVNTLSPATTRSVSEVGTGALADRRIFARTDLLLLDPTTSAESQIDAPVGSAITAISASTSATLLVTNETSRCISGGLPTRIVTMKLTATPNSATSYERMVVRKTSKELTFDVVGDPCEASLAGEGVALDLTPGDAILSDSATTSSMTSAYVSVITGDPEVIVIRRAFGTTKAWDASNNKI